MSGTIRIRKGLDIKLKGKAEKIFLKSERAKLFAIKPTDFHGVTPKLTVKPEDKVDVGTVLFYSKNNPEIKFTSPVSGKISAINRGERRKILEVIIEADQEDRFIDFKVGELSGLSRSEVINLLMESGLWPSIRQRPYDTIARPDKQPKAIFISGFDTAPLAPDYDFVLKDFKSEFQKGVDVLKILTEGDIHLSLDAEYPSCDTFKKVNGVRFHKFKGPHPAGNVGIQIHHIAPINKGETVWYVNPAEVVRIGKFFQEGKLDNNIIIALTGSEVEKPLYLKTIPGSSVESLVPKESLTGNNRIISGNVLTGRRLNRTGFISYYDKQLTVIPEGDHYDFFGWASLGFGKYSTSRTFWSWLSSSREYRIDTNLKGGERAFVMTGEYEKVLPMDILPVQLLKSILVEDIDQMEKLGIYEISEEDIALCEFVCTSKINIQEIIRKGMDLMIKETE